MREMRDEMKLFFPFRDGTYVHVVCMCVCGCTNIAYIPHGGAFDNLQTNKPKTQNQNKYTAHKRTVQLQLC